MSKRGRGRGSLPRFQRERPPKEPKEFRLQIGADELKLTGPVLPAQLEVPPIIAEELVKLGREVPKPVFGVLLIDTGASRTCISQAAANALGLTPVRLQTGYGAGGLHRNPVYRVTMSVYMVDRRNLQNKRISWEGEAQGVPELEKQSEAIGLRFGGSRTDYIGLLGRDVLRYTTLSYDGTRGGWAIKFDINAIRRNPAF